MSNMQGLLDAIHKCETEIQERRKRPGGKLEFRIMNERHSDEEWLELRQEVGEFLKTASEQDKKDLGGCVECLSMICSGIERKQNKKR